MTFKMSFNIDKLFPQGFHQGFSSSWFFYNSLDFPKGTDMSPMLFVSMSSTLAVHSAGALTLSSLDSLKW